MTAVAAALADDLGVPGVALRRAEPMARHTSMRIGGPAELFCEVETASALAACLRWAVARSLPVFVLGGGTNLVVADAGIPGLTIKLGRSFSTARWEERDGVARVVVGGAANLKRLVVDAIARGFAGLEFAEGIPGTVGGGLLMNAGAFGGEISQVVAAIDGVTREGEEVRLPRGDLAFAYRRLDLPLGFVVTAVEMRLERGDREALDRRVGDAKRKRGRGQPLGVPNAGSIFKNPPGDFAGRLIELVGLKGARAGGAEISPQHANFIVNRGDARAADVRALMRLVQETVWRRRGVWLQPEVKLVGDWEAAAEER